MKLETSFHEDRVEVIISREVAEGHWQVMMRAMVVGYQLAEIGYWGNCGRGKTWRELKYTPISSIKSTAMKAGIGEELAAEMEAKVRELTDVAQPREVTINVVTRPVVTDVTFTVAGIGTLTVRVGTTVICGGPVETTVLTAHTKTGERRTNLLRHQETDSFTAICKRGLSTLHVPEDYAPVHAAKASDIISRELKALPRSHGQEEIVQFDVGGVTVDVRRADPHFTVEIGNDEKRVYMEIVMAQKFRKLCYRVSGTTPELVSALPDVLEDTTLPSMVDSILMLFHTKLTANQTLCLMPLLEDGEVEMEALTEPLTMARETASKEDAPLVSLPVRPWILNTSDIALEVEGFDVRTVDARDTDPYALIIHAEDVREFLVEEHNSLRGHRRWPQCRRVMFVTYTKDGKLELHEL